MTFSEPPCIYIYILLRIVVKIEYIVIIVIESMKLTCNLRILVSD